MNKLAKGLNITGNTVSSRDDAFFYHMISGKNGIYNYGNKMNFQTVSANLIRIKDGMAQVQGRNYIIYPSETVDVAVESGTQGNKRNDIIVLEFTKTSSNETMEIKCIKGNPSTGDVTDPQITQQDTLSSGTKYQLPLYRVKLNGINIEGVDDLRIYIPSINDIIENSINYLELDGSTIAIDKNWNDLESNKIYLVNGTCKTSLNAPIDGDLKGVLIYGNMENGAFQFYLPRVTKEKIYVRGKYGGQWNGWISSADGGNASKLGNQFPSYYATKQSVDNINTKLQKNFNQNRIELTNSSYYPTVVCYRSGQAVSMKCAGTLEKEVPADAPYCVGIESMMPEEFRPNTDIIAYPNISFAGKNIKVEIKSTGRVNFYANEKLPKGFGLNMHFTYMTGKSNF